MIKRRITWSIKRKKKKKGNKKREIVKDNQRTNPAPPPILRINFRFRDIQKWHSLVVLLIHAHIASS